MKDLKLVILPKSQIRTTDCSSDSSSNPSAKAKLNQVCVLQQNQHLSSLKSPTSPKNSKNSPVSKTPSTQEINSSHTEIIVHHQTTTTSSTSKIKTTSTGAATKHGTRQQETYQETTKTIHELITERHREIAIKATKHSKIRLSVPAKPYSSSKHRSASKNRSSSHHHHHSKRSQSQNLPSKSVSNSTKHKNSSQTRRSKSSSNHHKIKYISSREQAESYIAKNIGNRNHDFSDPAQVLKDYKPEELFCSNHRRMMHLLAAGHIFNPDKKKRSKSKNNRKSSHHRHRSKSKHRGDPQTENHAGHEKSKKRSSSKTRTHTREKTESNLAEIDAVNSPVSNKQFRKYQQFENYKRTRKYVNTNFSTQIQNDLNVQNISLDLQQMITKNTINRQNEIIYRNQQLLLAQQEKMNQLSNTPGKTTNNSSGNHSKDHFYYRLDNAIGQENHMTIENLTPESKDPRYSGDVHLFRNSYLNNDLQNYVQNYIDGLESKIEIEKLTEDSFHTNGSMVNLESPGFKVWGYLKNLVSVLQVPGKARCLFILNLFLVQIITTKDVGNPKSTSKKK